MFSRGATQACLNHRDVPAKRYWRFQLVVLISNPLQPFCAHLSLLLQEGWTWNHRGRTRAGRRREWVWLWGGSGCRALPTTSNWRCVTATTALLQLTSRVLIHCHTDGFTSTRLWCIVLGKQKLAEATTRSVWTFVSRRSVPGQRLSEVHVRREGRPPAVE